VSWVSFVGGQFAISIYQIIHGFYPSPRQNPICQTRHGGTSFGGWGYVLYRADVSHGMRASPSTFVLTIDWQVRSLCHCLWYARGLYFCPCVITPRGFTSLPTQEAEYSFSGLFQQTNKQTNKSNKQTNKQTNKRSYRTSGCAFRHKTPFIQSTQSPFIVIYEPWQTFSSYTQTKNWLFLYWKIDFFLGSH